ncbi:MAG TPA: ABC transporter permease [bacterium]|nr:ABC transporter permease [bacterium]
MVRSYAPAAPPAVYPERPAGFVTFLGHVFTVADAEIRKLQHDPVELLMRAVQPTLWLVVFGQVMSHLRGVPTGKLTYLDFMAPGILAQSVLFIAIFYGVSAIRERDMGVLQKYLVSPISRVSLVLGKAISASVRALSQGVIVYILALLLHIHATWQPLNILGVLLLIVMGSAVFSTFSLVIACIVKTHERVMGMGQVMTMPLFFASNAIYPIVLMPGWLKIIATVNPLTYEVDGLRALMVQGGTSVYGLGVDFAVLLAFSAALMALAARLYPRLVT